MSDARGVRGYATFLADVPDDQVEEGGEIVKPGGAAIGELLRASVAQRGLATTPVYQHSFYGWAFDVTVGGKTVWCMLQFPDPWLLITDVRESFLGRLFRGPSRETHEAVLSILRETLAATPFRSTTWTTRSEYNAQAEAVPIE
jgi:hypothetical protein